MSEDYLLMNDTFDNLTFSEFSKSIFSKCDKKQSLHISEFKESQQEVIKSTNNSTYSGISFDDTAFLNDISFTCIEKQNDIHKNKLEESHISIHNKENLSCEATIKLRSSYSQHSNIQKNYPVTKGATSECGKNILSLIGALSISQEDKPLFSKSENKLNENESVSELVSLQKTLLGKNHQLTLSFNNSLVISQQSDQSQDQTPSGDKLNLASWGLPECILKIYAQKNIKYMLPWQFECLSKKNVTVNTSNLVYSAPTSAGKTLVAEILAIKTAIERKKKVIFILPFVSVVREKMFYFQDLFSETKVRVEGFMGSYNPPGGFDSIDIAICTIEKANSLINKLLTEEQLSVVGAVIVDEIHLIGDPSRGYLLELLLTKLKYMSLKNEDIKIQIIGMSATLPNLDHIAGWLNSELFITTYRPIPLLELVHVNGDIYNNELKLVRRLSPLSGMDVDTDNLLQLCLETIQESCSVLIFCPTKNWCENLAQQIAAAFWQLGMSDNDLGNILRTKLNSEMIGETLQQLKLCPVGLDAVLKKTVSFGVGVHHAGLTMDERDIIEGAFRNGTLKVLVATSTLSSGVNLPARRVIIRTPMFHGKPIDCLTYRQMIGRAGRMGKDTLGESILICQKNDNTIAKQLLSAKLDAVESCLEDSGKIKRAILEIIASGIATTPNDLNLFTNCTLLAYTQKDNGERMNPIEEAIDFLRDNEFIRLHTLENGTSVYVATALAKACLSSSLPPHDGLALFAELEKARRCFVLETELHLIYVVTPYSACHQWGNIDWMLFLELWTKLPASMKRVGELVGVEESYIVKATRGQMSTNTTKLYNKLLIHKRFFIALALQDLVNECSLIDTAKKFSCNRGMLQSLQQAASTFAGMVTSFSKQLRWSSVEILISQFQDRLHYGVNRDLLELMRLPVLNGMRARALFNAGIETLSDLANSDVLTVENILLKLTPFESSKEREGESAFENMKRNKLRNIWISGKEGITEREAACMLISEARKFLEIELGLVEAKWNSKDSAMNKLQDIGSLAVNVKTQGTTDELSNQENSDTNSDSSKTLKINDQENNNEIQSVGDTSEYTFSPLTFECSDKNETTIVRKSFEIKDVSSDRSLFEDSFTSNSGNSMESSVLKHSEPSAEIPNEDGDNCVEPSALKKRRCSNNLVLGENFTTPLKKSKTDKNLACQDNDTMCDFSKFDIIDVCKHPLVFDAFQKHIKMKTVLSLSVGCSKITENVCTIGERVLNNKAVAKNTQKPKFSDDSKEINGIAVSWGEGTVYYMNFQNSNYACSLVSLFKELLSNKIISIKIFDSKEQIKLLNKCCDIDVGTNIEDPKIADWLLEPDGKEKTLKQLILEHCPEAVHVAEVAGCYKGRGSIGLDAQSSVHPRIRSSVEALLTWYLIDNVKDKLFEQNILLVNVFDVEMKCVVCLNRMENRGFRIDRNYMNTLIIKLQEHLHALEKKAYSITGRKFSMASSKEVARVLGLSNGKKVSTKKDVLKKIQHPVSDLVLEWRKIHFTLYKMIIPLLHEIKDDKIHVNCITHNSTGRISMHEPNLQNVTKDFEITNPVNGCVSLISCRSSFVPSKESILLSADYCQLELRILAHLSQDAVLCRIMKNKGDIFKSIAAKWNHTDESQVSDMMRQHAKQICYGIIYGMGNKALAEQLSVTEEEASEFVERFHVSYPGLRKYIKTTIENCRENGYVETLSGRRRYLPHIKDANIALKSQAERQAVNTTIQGSAADIAKNAMVLIEERLENKFEKSDCKPGLVLHLHDELIYEIPSSDLRNVAEIVKNSMEKSVRLSIPFPVKLKSGPSWGQLTEFTL